MTIYAFRPAPYDPLDSNNPQTMEFRGSNDLGQVVGFYNPNPGSFSSFVYNPGARPNGGYFDLNSPYPRHRGGSH